MSKIPATIDPQAAKRFVLIRKFLKLNQTEMAEACNVSQSAIAKIEGATLDIPQAVMKLLYVKFNISPVYLLVGEAPMVYNKPQVNTLVKNIPEMQADIEILKAQIKLLTTFISETKRNPQQNVTNL